MMDVSEIDWNEAWKAMERTKREKEEFTSCVERWGDTERCRKYSRMVQEDDWKQGRDRIRAMQVAPESRVLDIGAGPGTLAIPLAGVVRHVTAVEPAPGMLKCLQENLKERGIRNVTTVRKKWEDVDVTADLDAPYDVVVASYSLGVPDLRAALAKMDAASSRFVYVFWFADMMSPRHRNYLAIWEDLFTIPPPAGRMPNIVFNLLNQMGIYANVTITRTDNVARFSTMEEAVADQRGFLNLKEERQVAVLRNYLEKTLRHEDGQYLQKATSYQAMIWWEKGV